MPHVDIELEDNKQFISNIPRTTAASGVFINNIKKIFIFFYIKVHKKIRICEINKCRRKCSKSGIQNVLGLNFMERCFAVCSCFV